MPSCAGCGIDEQFDARRAEGDLRRFRRRGLDASTKQLLAAIAAAPVGAATTLLDIGGGVGSIHHELLARGFAAAVHVDRSAAFIAVATREAARRGHGGRVRFVQGDFRGLASQLGPADVVTLDRVVCCDPDCVGLLEAAASRVRHTLALTYPRDRWFVRAIVTLSNAWRWLRGSAFRVYVHPPALMAATLEREGLQRTFAGGTLVWRVELFARALTTV